MMPITLFDVDHYSLFVDFDIYSEWHDWMLISDGGYSRNHDPYGVTAQGGKKVSP